MDDNSTCPFQTTFRLDPESRDVSNCHSYQFLEICIPLCNDPIGLIQKGHLKNIAISLPKMVDILCPANETDILQ